MIFLLDRRIQNLFNVDQPDIMDENLLSLLEELSLRSYSEDDNHSRDSGLNYMSSNYTSSSNVSSPNYEQLASNVSEEDVELKSAVSSLFQNLYSANATSNDSGYDKYKLLIALLGNINRDLVTSAVNKINQLIAVGKKMEHIYRQYYVNPDVELNLEELNQLIQTFSELYNSESYVREVNISRVYQAYCQKLVEICKIRTSATRMDEMNDDEMITNDRPTQ